MADKKDKSQDLAKNLGASATYLERLPLVGNFFKKARQNVEQGNAASAKRASGANMQAFHPPSAARDMNKKKRSAAGDMGR